MLGVDAIAAPVGAYGGSVAVIDVWFGRAPGKAGGNPLLDWAVPEYDVRQPHSPLSGPTDVMFATARAISCHDLPVVRTTLATGALWS
jgi:hypothetical protein